MKFFASTQKYFASMGLMSSHQMGRKHSFNKNNISALFIMTSASVLCIIYLLFEVNNFKEYTDSVCMTFTVTIATIVFAIEIWKTKSVCEFFHNFEDLTQKSEYKSWKSMKFIEVGNKFGFGYCLGFSKSIYEETNRRVDKWCEIMSFALIKLSPPSIAIPKIIISCFNYFVSDLGRNSYELPLLMWYALDSNPNYSHLIWIHISKRLPFDWSNPCGYLIAISIGCYVLLYNAHVGVCIMSHIVGGSWMLLALTEDIKDQYYQINKIAKFSQNRSKLFIQFSGLIQFDSSAKQLSITKMSATCQ